ncbi:hypothetical protein C1646_753314, partial [Rhizophagus diaphanus]
NKNELEEVIKRILDKYLKKENEETTNEITETEERLRKVKELIKYLEIEVNEGELLIEEIKRILDEYLEISVNENEEINEENELSIEEMVQKLLKERNEVLETVTEIEIHDKKVREKLNEYILELENKKKDEYDTDESEKIEEILSPGEYDKWDKNIENIRENEIENNINTEKFNLSQELDKNSLLINNSDTESELCPFCIGQYQSIEDMQWICKNKHRWKAIPNSIQQGCWCPCCAGHMQLLTLEDAKQIALSRYGQYLSTKPDFLKIPKYPKGLELDIPYYEYGFAIEDQLKKELCEENWITLRYVWYYEDPYVVIPEHLWELGLID